MLRLLSEVPLFVVDNSGKQTSYPLERGSLVRVRNLRSINGAIPAEVMAGKYEGLKGNIPAIFCAPDTMTILR